jgi:plasminogen activator inhibitor 1 RNA-binding protein
LDEKETFDEQQFLFAAKIPDCLTFLLKKNKNSKIKMSVVTQNLFDLLGDDAPSASVTALTSKPAATSNKTAAVQKKSAAPASGRMANGAGPVANPKNMGPTKGKGFHHHRPAHGREFDRKSGTGRRDTQKKQVVGKGNWGDEETGQLEAEKVKDELVKEYEFFLFLGVRDLIYSFN